MPLASGARLGPYEVLTLLGSGGMGEVYKARDTTLGRDVALKVLPDLFAGDSDRLARFEREAKALAALNHPHIAQIYGVGDVGDGTSPRAERSSRPRFLVMEFVDGLTLADRLAHGPLPFDEALPMAIQLAEALEYAHEHGIVHRDLKPANIKVTSDGTVKVLDFGLAKALAPGDGSPGAGTGLPSPDAADSPTITSPAMTRMGIILGTAAYMSPEQARGTAVDKRADIWAFGVVLFEMLAGRPCFAGDTVTDVLAAVMRADPDWTKIPADTPPRVRELLERCLTKDRRERLHDIGDARLELAEARRADTVAPVKARWPRREILAWAIAALALAVVAVVITQRPSAPVRDELRSLRLSVLHPEGYEVGAPAISPDGRRVAYRARRADGMPLIWVRDLATGEARALAGTEDGSQLFWSPDSHDLGFFAAPSIKRIPADGGPVQIITTSPMRGASWAPDGTIVFSPGDTALFQVSARGGESKPLTQVPSPDWGHYWPSFLPDGHRFLFTAKLWTRAAEAGEQGIYLGSFDSPEIRRLLPDLSSAVYAPPGYLVFVRDENLTAVPFDLATGRVTGEASPIGGRVAVDSMYYFSAVSAAADGTLAVKPPPAVALIPFAGAFTAELRLVDRSGRLISISPAELYSSYMALAPPDGRRVAASVGDQSAGTQDLWLVDLAGGIRTPVMTTRGYSGWPVWSSDGLRLAFGYQPLGQMDDVYVKHIRTGQVMPVIQSPTGWEHPVAWSRDGGHLLVAARQSMSPGVERELLAWSFASRTLTRFATNTGVTTAVFSSDDRYVAFTSTESGRTETCVTTFPERRQTWALTTEGGWPLSWRADGREILVSTLSGHIVAYPVTTTGGGFSAGQPTILVRDVGIAAPFSSATPDHSKILIRVSPEAAKDKGEIRLLFDWQATLKARGR